MGYFNIILIGLIVPIIMEILLNIANFKYKKRFTLLGSLIRLILMAISLAVLAYIPFLLVNITGIICFASIFFTAIFYVLPFVLLDLAKKTSISDKLANFRYKLFGTVFGLSILLSFVILAATALSPMTSYNSLTTQTAHTEDVPTMKKDETPVAISTDTARSEMRKAMSDIDNSQYYVLNDNIQAQYYKGKPVYIAGIDFKGFMQYNKMHELPGYFMISATDPDAQPQFIKKPIKYAPSFWFNHKSDRAIARQSLGYKELSDGEQLEIDDNGTPYYVDTLYKKGNINGRVNYKQVKIAVLNAETGKSTLYKPQDAPKFIDEGFTSDVASGMNDIYGKYNHGFWNTTIFGAKQGVAKPTHNGTEDGVTSMFDKNGRIQYVEDYTSSDSSKSAIGYSTTDARTGKITYYKLQNVMDSDSATDNANENYRAQKWQAKMPILYNVYGHPTWVMSILDNTNTLRGYYYLDAANQNLYANSSTANATLAAFRQALITKAGTNGNHNSMNYKKYQGVVDRMAIVNDGSKSVVEFMLKGNKTIFTANPAQNNRTALIRPGDKVEFKASVVEDESNGSVTEFKANF
ncbi:hypothetical protein FD06_GL000662 [Apilactobacillus ozensis DSM 23829 = JCM 17196]|uniref:Membrane associated protein n=1 Tax=Apilactobacillus ozensis DSM 23829 = JCM 17196 TaxID=1423781 RepID=A0A0R2AKT0_9LACO|nr:hypothetical protein [Apilactobacillus ozensis]KRM67511.1 hypothetical protein FD06_GL000662 [Apilactobacillus ozensis DSM 23829 = JCM 17196]